MKKFKKVFRYLFLAFLILLALSGVLFALAPRRPDQDYDDKLKTEIIEGEIDEAEMSNKN